MIYTIYMIYMDNQEHSILVRVHTYDSLATFPGLHSKLL